MNPPTLNSNPKPSETASSWFSGSTSSIPSFVGVTMENVGSTNYASSNQAAHGGQASQPAMSFSENALNILSELRKHLQPWSDFCRFSKFGLPPGISGVGPRVKKNTQTFLSNYLCIFIGLLIYCIITSLLMLLTLLVLAGLCYTVYQRSQKGPINLAGYEVPPSLLYTLALMVCIPLFALSDAGQVIYWVIGAGFFVMLAHAVFYASEEIPGAEFEVVTSVHVQA